MVYVALLRGINVGGKAKVEMARLKQTFEAMGFTDVKTYINSGNVIFSSPTAPHEQAIEAAISKDFGFIVPATLRSRDEVSNLVNAIPADWTNDASMKCDVMFMWPELSSVDVRKLVSYKPELEDVLFLPSTIVWRVDRANVNRGGLLKIVGTDPYKKMTIRNINTVRKLHELMQIN